MLKDKILFINTLLQHRFTRVTMCNTFYLQQHIKTGYGNMK